MNNKKVIIAIVLSAVLFIGNSVLAQSSNDLLRMDVKKASSEDTVDVTFYTTGVPTNSVVTRKSGNTYVVLLPNVAGTQSIVPSLGGVKELVSDVSVKNVDDGIGGYTKVTFNTTKPIKIQTYTKKTAPLTKAQQDYKNLIAQNSKFDPDIKMEHFRGTQNTSNSSSASVSKSASTNSPVTKTVQNISKNAIAKTPAASPAKTANTASNKTNTTTQNKMSFTSVSVHVPTIKAEASKAATKVKEEKVIKSGSISSEKKVIKPETKGKIATDALTNVKPEFDLTNPPKESTTHKAIKNSTKPISKKNNKPKNSKNVKTHQERKGLPIIPIAGGLSVLGIFMLGGLINIIARSVASNSSKLKEYLENYTSEKPNKDSENYQSIINDENLTWQEKYKKYSQKQHETKNDITPEMSYIAGMNGSSGVIVPDDMRARVSQMEHALSKTPDLVSKSESSGKVYSAEDAIIKSMSGLNLKSFAKHINLKQTSRNNSIEHTSNSSQHLKEGPHVALKPTALSMSTRRFGDSGFNLSELLRKGKRYLNQDIDVEKMNKEQEQYILSSLNEYLDILDAEKSAMADMAMEEQISNLVPKHNRDMMGVTNPMERNIPFKSSVPETSDFGGITVKSKYDIDNDKSIFMVDSDGVSALIGKIGDEIFVLKKFDKVINKPLQVRLDYGNVYIVKVGGFKCLVDVTDEKMGTLLEI